MGPVKAFSLSGRFSVSVAIRSFTSYSSSSAMVRSSVLRQPQDALPQNVFQDLGGAGSDRAGPRQQAVVRPLPLVRGPGALRDLDGRSQDLRRQLGQLLIHLAPGELGGGPLAPA